MKSNVGFRLLASAAVVAALAVAGVFGAATPNVKTHTVVIENMKFSPAELRIALGDRVVFENKDLYPHTATAEEPKVFDSGPIKAGDSWSHQPVAAETIRYVCLLHPTMEGRIVVDRP